MPWFINYSARGNGLFSPVSECCVFNGGTSLCICLRKVISGCIIINPICIVSFTTIVNRRISKGPKECALSVSVFPGDGYSKKSKNMALSRSIGYTFTITRAHRVLPAVQDLFAEESDLYLDEVVCTRLAFEHDIIISPSKLSRNLEQAGLTPWKALQVCYRSKNEHTYARLYGRAARRTSHAN
ncbi:hypothetical protein C8R48DRAFT_699817 [Suillus tomentosus]|nr:hypothetical protein C8R48DRAFT_699817 [Suillus tomentosus]